MKLAAFGDIHSNHYAFEACLDRAEREYIDGVIFLGDYVSDCPCPQTTLALMRQVSVRYPTWIVRGNREEYMLAHEDNPGDDWKYNSQTGSLKYTFDNLRQCDLDAFRTMPIGREIRIGGEAPFEICHGSMSKSRVMLLPGTPEADEALAEMRTDLMLCAHTHQPFVLEKNGRTIVNGGAVGVPSNGNPDAGFVLLESNPDGWLPRLMKVKYDVEAEIREFHESGFCDKARVWARAIIATLRTGGEYTMECLRLVGSYSRRSGLPFGAESLWEKAADELGI